MISALSIPVSSAIATAENGTSISADVTPPPAVSHSSDYNPYMSAAISSAMAGIINRHGGPFGASIVKNGVIIAVSHNLVIKENDPTCHAEMSCIRRACTMLSSHDLSECELFTTCEPCPMCWGAAYWARIGKVSVGCDRVIAAKFGFDDEFFYQEVDLPMEKRSIKMMMGIMQYQVQKQLFEQSLTYRRRLCAGGGLLAKIYEKLFSDENEEQDDEEEEDFQKMKVEDPFMKAAMDIARIGAEKGESKEREPFGAVIVREGEIIAESYNTVLKDTDPTATAEINCIRKACNRLRDYKLCDCEMYTTTEPDLMSLGAIYWSRLKAVHIGVSQKLAARFGYEDGLLHYKELEASIKSRYIESKHNVMLEQCEQVFARWKASEGDVY